MRLSDAAARWQAQDPGRSSGPSVPAGSSCNEFASKAKRVPFDAPWEEFMKLFRAGEQDAGYGVW